MKWLLEKLMANDEEKTVSLIYILVKEFYSSAISMKAADRELGATIFNAKYASAMRDDKTPGEVLQDFYNRAGKGDKSYLLHYFHSILRTSGDKHVGKLNYKLKRNER